MGVLKKGWHREDYPSSLCGTGDFYILREIAGGQRFQKVFVQRKDLEN